MMGDVINLPRGFGPALRVISGNTASAEQRKAALGLIGATYPEDLLWAAPGEPVTRRLTDAELTEIMPPEQWRAEKVTGDGWGPYYLAGLILAAFLAGFICGGYTVLYSMIGRL